eukprot:m.121596 g.121596  ORF g.121596 m.121596 type:complete len:406 (+) comp52097_c0_seq7:140-1357(+)
MIAATGHWRCKTSTPKNTFHLSLLDCLICFACNPLCFFPLLSFHERAASITQGYDVGGEFRNDQCKNNNLLHFTAYFGSVNCFMYLVEAMGFDTTVRNKHGLTALEIANSPVPHGWWFSDAAQRGRPQIVTYLQQLQQGQARPATFRPAQNRGPSARPGGSARPPARPVSQRANSLGAPGGVRPMSQRPTSMRPGGNAPQEVSEGSSASSADVARLMDEVKRLQQESQQARQEIARLVQENMTLKEEHKAYKEMAAETLNPRTLPVYTIPQVKLFCSKIGITESLTSIDAQSVDGQKLTTLIVPFAISRQLGWKIGQAQHLYNAVQASLNGSATFLVRQNGNSITNQIIQLVGSHIQPAFARNDINDDVILTIDFSKLAAVDPDIEKNEQAIKTALKPFKSSQDV